MKKLVLAFLSMFIISVAYADTCPNGQYWDTLGGECLNCNNLPASYAHYTGPGTTISNCPWSCNDGHGWNGSACAACLNGQYGPNLSNACNACDAGEYGSPAGPMCYSCGGTGSWPNTYCPLNGGSTATVSTACPTNSSGSDSNSATVTGCYISSCNSSITECNPSHGHLSGKCYYATGTSLNQSSGTCSLASCDAGYHDVSGSCVANTITISYDANTGTGSETSTNCTYGGTCDLSAGGTMSKTGHTLTNWCTSPSGGTCYALGSSHPELAEPNTNIILYAQWTVATYTISLTDGSGASGGSGTIKEVYGTEWRNFDGTLIIDSVAVPSKTGYTFTGYWAAPTGGTEPIIPATGSLTNPGLSNTYFTANTTIYAQWTVCAAGTYYLAGSCVNCEVGYYCSGTGGSALHNTCPAGHTSAESSDAQTDCYITTGPTAGTRFCDDGGDRCFQLPDLGSPANNIIHYQN